MPKGVRRLVPALLAAAAGLFIRAFFAGGVAKYGGVAAWAAALGFLLAASRPSAGTLRLLVGTVAIAWAVEFAQLSPLPARISAAWKPLGWIFGSVFSWSDLPAYLAGALLAAAIDSRIRAS